MGDVVLPRGVCIPSPKGTARYDLDHVLHSVISHTSSPPRDPCHSLRQSTERSPYLN
jgi:hypothetical protein